MHPQFIGFLPIASAWVVPADGDWYFLETTYTWAVCNKAIGGPTLKLMPALSGGGALGTRLHWYAAVDAFAC
mgnify:CR=1 FL=1